jgi:hypothetical protein
MRIPGRARAQFARANCSDGLIPRPFSHAKAVGRYTAALRIPVDGFVKEMQPNLPAPAECRPPIAILHATPSATPPYWMSGVSSLTSAIRALLLVCRIVSGILEFSRVLRPDTGGGVPAQAAVQPGQAASDKRNEILTCAKTNLYRLRHILTGACNIGCGFS